MKTALLVLIGMIASAVGAEEKTEFELKQSVAMPGVEKRIDHLALDAKANRLFVAALGNNTVEVVDLSKGVRVQSLAGFDEPQGIAFLPDLGKVVVASGGDGSCRFYNGETLKLEKSVDLKADADNVRYDAASKRLYVGHVDGALAVINAETGQLTADIKLSSHPEAFEIDATRGLVYVNVPSSQQVEVVDLAKGSVVDTWKIKVAKSNFPMALDAANNRLYLGCRSPAELVVLDTATGKVIDSVKCVGDADEVFWDSDSGSAIVVGGAGYVEEFKYNKEKLHSVAQTKTRHGARTGLFVPQSKQLFVAAPKASAGDAAILALQRP